MMFISFLVREYCSVAAIDEMHQTTFFSQWPKVYSNLSGFQSAATEGLLKCGDTVSQPL